jgi:hypothetical protein
MAGKGEIFRQQITELRQDDLGIITTPTYFDAQMSRTAANEATWAEFKRGMQPFGIVRAEDSDVEFLLTPKTSPWGMEDINIFAGSPNREIVEIDDFESREGQAFLETNFTLVEGLLEKGHCASAQVTVGFNPHDLSIGHHSVLKLHSHVRVTPNPADMPRREQRSWHTMERFDKLAFIEPFAPLYQDYIEHAVELGALYGFLASGPHARHSHTTVELFRSSDLPKVFDELARLYGDIRTEYGYVEAIFTDRNNDETTGRPLPRPKEERLTRLEEFLIAREGFYSARSTSILRYLAENLHKADPRDPDNITDLSTAQKTYITRGFAGALVFGFDKNKRTVRFDFNPVVLSTSSVTRTLMGEELPTVVLRVPETASEEEKSTYRIFRSFVAGVLQEKMPAEFTRMSN